MNRKPHIEWSMTAIKNEIYPFTTAWMDVEGIMLHERWRRTNTIRLHLYVESKGQNKQKKETDR